MIGAGTTQPGTLLLFVLLKLIFQSTGCDLQLNRPSESESRPERSLFLESRCQVPCGPTGPSLPPPLLGRGSDLAPLQAVCTVPLLVGRFCPSSPGGSLSRSPGGGGWCVQGEEASSFPSPLLLGGITSPTPLPPLGPPSTPLPHQQLPTHISLYLALLQISQKYPRSHSPCLGPLVPQAGAAPVGPASWSLLSRPSHPRPSTSLPGAGGKPLRCQPGALQAHLRPRRSG